MDNLSDTEKEAAISQMPVPQFKSVFELPHPDMSKEYLEKMDLENQNQARYIEAVKTTTWVGRKVTFNPPFEHRLGEVVEHTTTVIWSPHPDKEHYVAHLQHGLADRIKFVADYKKTLGIN